MKPRSSVVVTTLFLIAASGTIGPATGSTELYVSVDGNDRWSGRLPAPNQAAADGPLASLAAARDAVRLLRAGGIDGPVRVRVSGGTYFLPETLQLGTIDSGTEAAPVTYAAAPGEHVIFSGGRRLSGWQPYSGDIWRVDLRASGLSGLRFRQLYYNGESQPLARVPNVDVIHPRTGGFTYVVGRVERQSKTRIKYDPAYIDAGRWTCPDKALVDIFSFHNYWNSIVEVRDVDLDNHVLTVGDGVSYVIQVGDRFFVKNVFEELALK